ncbi:hypothetical protein ACJQWK_05405 [Exserohilum turcicum]|uniref:GIY-YIG domain-containing protein n=1 Tax=Exserohilum turcicum (strain 28A) TaxID=671987 RepID=R0JXV1_EXST2|nr:uncharacterized protein SETTUDRAFT_142478 [Exserohilum turcica Et28A]EOA82324.1 hypothetical protein SETTUDRAFT_142478 [Exserohilum turcica Et28A]
MATIQSQAPQSVVPASRTPTSDPSNKLTPAQAEARSILDHLLIQLQSPDPSNTTTTTTTYHTTYGPWIQRHGQSQLAFFCHSLVRPQTWHFLAHRWSLDALKPLSGDLRYEGRAIYLNGILGLDKRLRLYVGQSTNLRQRVGQHLNFRYRRDHPSLHYFALHESVYNVFATLVILPHSSAAEGRPGMDDVPLLLNVLEMWMCLVFRALPDQTLQHWLPGDGSVDQKRKVGKEGLVGGLNVACPLDQGTSLAERVFVDLEAESDPLVRAYLRDVERKKRESEDKDEESEMLQRRKLYAEKARAYRGGETDVRVPQWVVYGTLAGVLGYILLNSRGGQRLRAWWR